MSLYLTCLSLDCLHICAILYGCNSKNTVGHEITNRLKKNCIVFLTPSSSRRSAGQQLNTKYFLKRLCRLTRSCGAPRAQYFTPLPDNGLVCSQATHLISQQMKHTKQSLVLVVVFVINTIRQLKQLLGCVRRRKYKGQLFVCHFSHTGQ